MCKFFSGILKKDGKVLYQENSNSHDSIVKHFKLDEKDDTKKWLRFEILQKDGDNDNHDLRTWRIKIDEPTTPDWYLRNKSFFDKKMRKALKENFVEPIMRFPIEQEAKLLKAFDRIFQIENVYTEEKAVKTDNLCAVDPAHVCLVKAKSERAKRFLARFANKGVRIPGFSYAVSSKKKVIPKSLYSLDYFQNVIKIFACINDHFAITIGKDLPATIEDEDFSFLLAPRIECE